MVFALYTSLRTATRKSAPWRPPSAYVSNFYWTGEGTISQHGFDVWGAQHECDNWCTQTMAQSISAKRLYTWRRFGECKTSLRTEYIGKTSLYLEKVRRVQNVSTHRVYRCSRYGEGSAATATCQNPSKAAPRLLFWWDVGAPRLGLQDSFWTG
jgi:hypothetical protein